MSREDENKNPEVSALREKCKELQTENFKLKESLDNQAFGEWQIIDDDGVEKLVPVGIKFVGKLVDQIDKHQKTIKQLESEIAVLKINNNRE